MTEWQPIETAPPERWILVSMRDVDRPPPEWMARQTYIPVRGRYPHRQLVWLDKEGRICAPTHWMPALAEYKPTKPEEKT